MLSEPSSDLLYVDKRQNVVKNHESFFFFFFTVNAKYFSNVHLSEYYATFPYFM